MSIIEKALDKLEDGDEKNTTSSSKKAKNTREVTARTASKNNDSDKKKKTASSTADKKEIELKSQQVNIDLDKLTEEGYLTPKSNDKILFEQYRRIKMPIIKKAFNEEQDTNNNIVMVTSSLEGEGKSFTSINLAMSIAYELNYTVLLIDADVTKRKMSGIFDLQGKKGLIEYLKGEVEDLSKLILKTNIPKLNLLPTGEYTENVTELYNSKKMGELIQELSRRYSDRLILIDTPPMLQDSSSSVIRGLVDQILFVIEAEKTPKQIVEKALSEIEDDKDVGLVLNKSNQKNNPGYYYSY